MLQELKKTVRVGKKGKKAMHSRIADVIRRGILNGDLQPGSKLPTGQELTESLGVSPVTVQNAIRILSSEGFVVPRRRLGTFVADHVPAYDGKVILVMPVRPERDDTFQWQYLEAITRAFTEARLEVGIEFFNEAWMGDFSTFKKFLMQMRGCCGVVILMPGQALLEQIQNMVRTPVRLVVMSAMVDSPVVSWGHSDDYGMCYEMVFRLVDMGHKRISFVYREEPSRPYGLMRRRKGFLFGVSVSGLESTACCVSEDDLEKHITGPNRPTALILDLSLKSQRVKLQMIEAHGLSIPSDISVIGYDATDLKTSKGLPLAAVSQPIEQVAIEVARLMSQRDDGRFEITIAQRFLPGETLMKLT